MICKIEYLEKDMIQYKTLISHKLWEEVKAIKSDKEYKKAKDKLGLFFTDQSPLYESIITGILHSNGQHLVKITPI